MTTVLQQLRHRMQSSARRLNGYLVLTADAHNSEYVSPHDQRRAFITGFDGSAGTALVTEDKAYLWTDTRYHLQADMQVSADWTVMKHGLPGVPSVEQWIAKNMSAGSVVGVHPTYISWSEVTRIQKALSPAGVELISVNEDVVDSVWPDQPPAPYKPVFVVPHKYTGRTVAEKLAIVRDGLREAKAAFVLISGLDDIAWLFNIRGGDGGNTPVATAFALVSQDSAIIFIDPTKLSSEVLAHFGGLVQVQPYDTVTQVLAKSIEAGGSVMIDPNTCNWSVYQTIPAGKVIETAAPTTLAKAVKTPEEQEGMRQANIKDAVAVIKCFNWLEQELADGKHSYTEHDIAEHITRFRAAQDSYLSPSFTPIVAYGPNAAIVHYHPPETGSAVIGRDSMLLVDSGGQYMGGTTDTTRTIHFGTPTDEECQSYTLVLKGHIAIATLVIPIGIHGFMLDSFARRALWDYGLDYGHGTGHGIGCCLNVHEGPQGISKRVGNPLGGFLAGMVVSNEPGYYKTGHYGIRIESDLISQPAAPGPIGPRTDFLQFETITPVPIQTKLVKRSLLTAEELAWLNEHNARCLAIVGPHLTDDESALNWLKRECAPI